MLLRCHVNYSEGPATYTCTAYTCTARLTRAAPECFKEPLAMTSRTPRNKSLRSARTGDPCAAPDPILGVVMIATRPQKLGSAIGICPAPFPFRVPPASHASDFFLDIRQCTNRRAHIVHAASISVVPISPQFLIPLALVNSPTLHHPVTLNKF